MTTPQTQSTKSQEWNEKIDWDEVEKEKKLHENHAHKKNESDEDEEEDVDLDEESAHDEMQETQ